MSDIVLASHAGGLGDHLLYSTLPMLLRRTLSKGERIFLVDDFRNPEVRNLIMENPFIDELVPIGTRATRGKMIFEDHSIIRMAKNVSSPILAVEALNGLVPEHRRPHIHYRARNRSEWLNRMAIDPTSISQPISPEAMRAGYDWVRRWSVPPETEAFVLTSPYAGPHGSGSLPNLPRYMVRDIYEYIDIMASCCYFLCAEGGSQTLAAAIRRNQTYSVMTTQSYNDRLFVFPNVHYYVTGSMTGDYHPY